ncbi:hypothetical protein GA069_26555 [Vibrio parahaemolyticus]|nr:hypothetical protein [Vibrio parahaemolyticus]EGQ9133348.1 hypothetical protein [Vibrio parahaemolyticus]EJB8450128.1 hypothetical protein [Vibrio parahaemolyticus]ELZ7234652.1 hypothetical protein [Vibrio parahaemolyticus]
MAAPKTTDLSTLDQLSTLETLHKQIESICLRLDLIRPHLEIFATVMDNANEPLQDPSMKVIDIFRSPSDPLKEIPWQFHYAVKSSVNELQEVTTLLEENIFSLKSEV